MTEEKRGGLSYRDAGVDVAGADALVNVFGRLAAKTRDARVVPNALGYAGLFDPWGERGPDLPLIAATCDGVGTKLMVAQEMGSYHGLGQDLVAMSVNDLAASFAKPLFFLDYLAAAELDRNVLTQIVGGIADACGSVGCALLGGETAEMPGLYRPGDFDLAGFAIGLLDRARVPEPESIQPGDIVIGLPSNGLHANGFSLARKALFEVGGLDVHSELDGVEGTLGGALIAPTLLYVNETAQLLDQVRALAAVHITGGGLLGRFAKLAKVASARVVLDADALEVPAIVRAIGNIGGVPTRELSSTFNMGVGFAAVVRPDDAKVVLNARKAAWRVIGRIEPGRAAVDAGSLGMRDVG